MKLGISKQSSVKVVPGCAQGTEHNCGIMYRSTW